MKKIFLPLIFCLFAASTAFNQSAPDRRPGEILIQLQGDATLTGFLSAMRQKLPAANARYIDTPADDWRIYRIGFDENAVTATAMLQSAYAVSGVSAAQLNHRASERFTQPNDPEWWRQSDMTLINAPDAWDASTGGFTPNGDTIVVAVLEKGALMTHPDLAEQRQFNWGEIPNNGVDDDNNGYTDDYAGWDAQNDGDGNGNGGTHGTAVNGIIGAKGNNTLGVSGINWNIRLLNISNTEYDYEIVAGYNYVAKMRKLYNKTNGAKGQFIVATNASFGIDKADPADYPLWCAVYDSLGKIGVLSVGATSNVGNNNIDLVGDMPTSCPSEFLITVTNTDKLDNLVPGSGYGSVGIDMSAPGQDTYTTASNANGTPTYGSIGGTSAATPHVTGSIALIYSLSCEAIASDALTYPADCARRVRDAILDNVAPNADLAGITVTGGRLDLGAAVTAAQEFCGPKNAIGLEIDTPVPVHFRVNLEYTAADYDKYQLRVFNMLGQLMYEETVSPGPYVPGTRELSTAHYPPGLYVVTISKYKFVRSKKFLKI